MEEIVELGGSYDEIKTEILFADGQTPDKLWKEMMSIRQGDESFCQFSLRVQRWLEQFQKLAVNENCDLVKTLVKYLVGELFQ